MKFLFTSFCSLCVLSRPNLRCAEDLNPEFLDSGNSALVIGFQSRPILQEKKGT